MRRLVLAAIPSLGLALATAGAAVAEQMMSDPVLTQNGHEYACTGVGMHARNDPRWRSFPLKLVFARPDGAYLTDFSVDVSGQDGTTLIDAHCRAPWFLAKLAPGVYQAKITSSFGLAKTVTLKVQESGQTRVVVTFNEG